jgi:hypothetical protein
LAVHLVPVRQRLETSRAAHEGGAGWGALVPFAWRALADPDGDHVWPVRPDDPFGQAVLTFGAALEVLWTTTGWPRLDLGADWWRRAGYPTDHRGLALVAELAGGQLDEFVAWLVTSGSVLNLECEIAHRVGTRPDMSDRVSVDGDWLHRVEALASGPGPLLGGGDPLHLSTHVMGPVLREPPATGTLLTAGPTKRRAALMLDRYAGWYSALAQHGAGLPQSQGDRSWRVDVVCRPVGHLGEFRLSRLSGRWFAGRNRIHQAGCER